MVGRFWSKLSLNAFCLYFQTEQGKQLAKRMKTKSDALEKQADQVKDFLF